jgi:muconolactone delta-isomerase
MDFITSLVTIVPEGTLKNVEADTRAHEAVRAAELVRRGYLLRLPSESAGSFATHAAGVAAARGEASPRAGQAG